MVCPNCQSEYEEGSTWCEECEVELVEGEEEEEEIEFLPLQEVTEADLFGQLAYCLEEAGIAWFVQSEESVAIVYVDKSRLEKARELCGMAEVSSSS